MLGLTYSTPPRVVGVFSSGTHTFTKYRKDRITLLEGLGVCDDAHCGILVQHRWDMKKDATRPNKRQVHLIQAELFDELNSRGFNIQPGDLGENITTRGIDLVALPAGTRLHIGARAIIEVTGLRSCCVHIESFQPGLLRAVINRVGGRMIRRAGVMGIVIEGGILTASDSIGVSLPPGPVSPLEVV